MNLSASQLPPGLLDAGCESLAAALSLPIPDDFDQILLLLFGQSLDHFERSLKPRVD